MDYSNKKSFVSAVGSILSVKILLYLIGISSSVYLARVLGPTEKGKLAVITSVYSMILQFGSMGIHSAHTYYVSKDRAKAKNCEGNILLLTGFTVVLSFVVLPFFLWNQRILNLDIVLTLMAFLLVPVNMFVMLQGNLFIAVGKVKQYNIIEVLSNSLYLIFVVVLSLFRPISAGLVAVCMFIALLIIDCYSLIMFFNHIDKSIVFSVKYLFSVVPYGIKIYCACLASYMVLRVDVLMLNYFQNSKEVGIYSLATSLVDMSYMVSSSIAVILFPSLGTISKLSEKGKMLKRVCQVSMSIMLGIYILMEIFVEYAIEILYGEQYRATVQVLRILIPGAFCWGSSNYLFQFFASENRFKEIIMVPIIALLVNVIMNLYLIPSQGSIGAAIASVCSYAVCFIGILISFIIYMKTHEEKAD